MKDLTRKDSVSGVSGKNEREMETLVHGDEREMKVEEVEKADRKWKR